MKENRSLRKQSNGEEVGVGGHGETEVKVRDDSPKMSALRVCTGTYVFIMHTECLVNIYCIKSNFSPFSVLLLSFYFVPD